MKKNVGVLDRIIRLGLSIILIGVLYVNNILFEDSIATAILLFIAIINIFVAITRVCPLYCLANIDTYNKSESKE